MGLPFGMSGSAGIEKTSGSSSSNATGTQTTQRILSKEALDKIMADMLGSEQGLAALANGENVSGASGSTMKTQLSQDFLVKIAGELASLTAPTITTTDQQQQTEQASSKKSGGLKTVICTELVRQGKLDSELYAAGAYHYYTLNPRIIQGYHLWAMSMVPRMQKSEKLSMFFLPIAHARYMHITGRKKNLLGFLTVAIGHPVCYLLSFFSKESYHGYFPLN